jgi:hypothetical protein
MLAVKGIYDNGQIKWREPFGPLDLKKPIQVVVLFLDETLSESTVFTKNDLDNSNNINIIPPESLAIMKLTDETGFVQDVINSKEEDCWNGL